MFQVTASILSVALQQSKRKLSIPRIDGNFYASYMAVLESLFNLVFENVYVIIYDIDLILMLRKHGLIFESHVKR